jgi:hypothetical protein
MTFIIFKPILCNVTELDWKDGWLKQGEESPRKLILHQSASLDLLHCFTKLKHPFIFAALSPLSFHASI